jgi:hypothetical protein
MKAYRTIVAIFLVCNFINLYGQDDTKVNTVLLKLYINGYYEDTKNDQYKGTLSGFDNYLYENELFDFGILSIAIEFKSEKFFAHEIEIMPVYIDYNDDLETISFYDNPDEDRVLSGGKNTSIKSYLRYQANHYFTKDKIVVPYIGLSAKAFYYYNGYNPTITTTFKTTEQNIGLHFTISPGISFKISKKLLLDIDIPIGLYETKLNMSFIDNPLIPVKDRKSSEIIGEFIPKVYNIRLGLFYKL